MGSPKKSTRKQGSGSRAPASLKKDGLTEEVVRRWLTLTADAIDLDVQIVLGKLLEGTLQHSEIGARTLRASCLLENFRETLRLHSRMTLPQPSRSLTAGTKAASKTRAPRTK